MKKIFVSMFIILSSCLYSIDYHTYDLEIVHVFDASQKGEGNKNDLAVNNFPGSGSLSVGPGIFFEEDKLVVSDQVNAQMRTIYLSKNYSFSNIYIESFYNSNVINYNNIILGYNNDYINAFDKNSLGSFKFNITTYDFKIFRNYKDIYYQDNTLFIFDKDYKLWAIKNPGLDMEKNRKNIINEDETIKEINSGKFKGLSIDSKNRLFLNNKLMTVDIKTFTDYSREIRTVTNKPLISFENSEDLYITGDASYIGSDIDGNKYWYQGSALLIFNTNGWPIEDFVVSEWEKVDTYPAVSPEGDVYFMNYGEDKVTLYKVKRRW